MLQGTGNTDLMPLQEQEAVLLEILAAKMVTESKQSSRKHLHDLQTS